MAKSNIHIKKSKVGSLHRALGIPEGEKIPADKLKDKPGDSPAMKKKKLFARNARTFEHEFGGELGDPDYIGMGIGFMNTIQPRNPNSKLAQRLYNTIKPDDYVRLTNKDNSDLKKKIKDFANNRNRFEDRSKEYSELSNQLFEANEKRDNKTVKTILNKLEQFDKNLGSDDDYSEDAWATYLGLPQKYGTLRMSNYRPTKSIDKNAKYYSLPDEFKNDLLNLYKQGEIKKGVVNERIFPSVFGENKSRARMLGNFTVDFGKDEKGEYMSYYDKYDLSPELPIVGKTKVDFIGKPFEVYDRIYLNDTKYMKGGKLNRGERKPYLINLYDDEVYYLGGWLKENDDAILGAGSGVLSGAASGMSLAGPVGGIVGGVIGGVSGLIGGHRKDEQENEEMVLPDIVMPRTAGRENMTPNIMHFKKGGKLSAGKAQEILDDGTVHGKPLTKKQRKYMQGVAHGMVPYELGGGLPEYQDNYTEIKGPVHEQGGVQFLPDAELEGGESVENNVVNSDSIKITPEIAELYGLPQKAVNRTVAGYRKSIEKKYEGRDGDPFAMKSKEIETNNISKMSAELGELYNPGKYAGGGPLPSKKKSYYNPNLPYSGRPRLYPDDSNAPSYLKQVALRLGNRATEQLYRDFDTQPLQYYYDYDGKLKAWIPEGNAGSTAILNPESELPQQDSVKPAKPAQPKTVVPPVIAKPAVSNNGPIKGTEDDILLERLKENNGIINPVRATRPVSGFDLTGADRLRPAPGINKKSPVSESMMPVSENNGSGILGLAPIVTGAINTIRATNDKPDKVRLPRLHAEDVNVRLIDPRYQLDQIGDTFATANEQMSQAGKNDMIRRRIQSATEEAKTKSGVLGQVTAANTQLLNQAEQINKQDRSRVATVNAELALQEENINAANEGTWETNRDFQLNNLGSMVGEYARDRRLEDADTRYRERWVDTVGNMFAGQTWSPETGWVTTGASGLPVNNKTVNPIDVRITDNKVNATNPAFNPSDLIEDPLYTRFGSHGQFRVPRANLGVLRTNYLNR